MPGIEKEAIIFVAAVLTGAVLRLSYECLTCLRQIIKHSLPVVNVEDLLFWIGAAVYLFVQIYQTSNGGIRWYFILGVVVGAVLMSSFVRKIRNLLKKIYDRTS